MDILQKARKLESTLARSLDRAAQGWAKSGPREPLEILHAVVDAIEERLEPAGRGKQVFPFNRIKVSVVADSRDARARVAAVLDENPLLQARVAKRLRDAGCDPTDVRVTTAYVARPESHWTRPDFHIVFDRVARKEATASAVEGGTAPVLKLTIVHGSAHKPSYTFALPRINLGRCAEIRDSQNRLIRTNHVAFEDGQGATNHSISRRHAHIEYLERTGHYRLSDDRSAHGTSIVRNGRTIPVPAGSRGVRLQSGDEIVVGEARARIRLDAD
jgi:hypothetical protein